ncbi:hypothetical protein [Actinoplanes campanulatus]|nr:hypothetical protein [Actinoplanes capillaceus]
MRILTSCVAAALMVALAGCSGVNGSPGTDPSSYVPTISDEELLTLGRAAVRCLRENGVADMPDPYVEDNRLKVPDDEMDAAEEKAGEQTWNAAEEACRETIEKIPEGALAKEGGGDPEPPGPEDVEALRKLAQCYRENGVPEWPDPDAEGRFPIKGTSLEDEKPEPGSRLDTARKACEQVWSGPVGIS